MGPTALRIHHYEPESQTNGPGVRFVIWLQGCTLGCPGCFNPESHLNTGGLMMEIDQLISIIKPYLDKIDGFTISGGEPLQQLMGCTVFIEKLREITDKTIILFTGYESHEFYAFPEIGRITSLIDVLISGRFQKELRVAKDLIGSKNKTFHFFSERLTLSDFKMIPPAEIFLNSDGSISISGIDPLQW